MFKYVCAFAAGLAAGIVLEKMLQKMNTSTIKQRSELLRSCFGEPMYTTNLTLTEVKDWLKGQEETLKNGAKAIVLKANSENLKNLGKDINIDGVDNYLVIAVVDMAHEMKSSVLIKYETLDQKLEELLSKGNGSLVIEG